MMMMQSFLKGENDDDAIVFKGRNDSGAMFY